MILIILGMHKSGTTLVSKMLHDSGICMVDGPENQGEYDNGNKMERSSTKHINHLILGSFDKFSLDVCKPETLRLNHEQQHLMIETIKNCSTAQSEWGFKDPRTCFTYPLWNEHLPDHRLIVVFRSPKEVWAHYWASARFYQKIKIFLKFIPRWCEYNDAILQALEITHAPFIVIDYSNLMFNPDEFTRLQDFVGHTLEDSRKHGMYRKRAKPSIIFWLASFIHRERGGADPNLNLSRLSDFSSEKVASKENESKANSCQV